MSQSLAKVPATIVSGFLGAGKTTLVRHVMSQARGRRIAIIVNEFGSLGIDGDLLAACGIPGCEAENIVELANGCICCTVADDFLPTMAALLDRAEPPEHILIETSGLALPKPLIKAFNWPSIRSRVTVDGVVTVVDGPAVAEGRFADDPEAVAAQRAADDSLDHDNPLAEVFEDQLSAADLVVLNKADLLDEAALARLRTEIAARLPRAVKVVAAREGALDIAVLLGLGAAAEDDLAARPSHHDGSDDHEHDDFDSFVVPMPEAASPEALVAKLAEVAARFDVLRMKGFASLPGKPMRLAVQGVGARFRHHFDRPWAAGEARDGRLVVIGQSGLDKAAIAAAIAG
ncbi:cobalamin biosynthesis protein CobW [Roseomonas haemaphysalidis]|uniref:Cobalamin biosynthesis protein CobW n=1 Tax=Roseomonas haemaphysalidis TaxID=2768162 RepID=A0ABS3KSZ3_9PROT|nr:cobalamin biosynthesis protein CobW [Roseomonas haemaphysalidis]MBO1080581.1 cobalamin biosynthesis protein CobW [Roseomonas haemaphysalidis]